MFIQKNSGTANHAPASPVSRETATSQTTPPTTSQASGAAASAKPPAASHQSVSESSIRTLFAAAGIPADKLSASIVSFARFFSLPLKPELMAAIRRQSVPPSILAQANPVIPDTGKAAAFDKPGNIREAFALAATGAESKGVELTPKGLESFAEAVNPDQRRRHDTDEGKRRNHGKDEQEKDNAQTAPITAAGLKKAALEYMENHPLLEILNRMPGKDGRRWAALPFHFSEGGKEFQVSLRILLEADNHAGRMALDIAESERRWLFTLAYTGHAVSMPANLTVYLQGELSPQTVSSYTAELSRLMNIPPRHIAVKTYAGSFSAESGEHLLQSVDEAV